MTHLLALERPEFLQISEQQVSFLLHKADRDYKAGDKLIVQTNSIDISPLEEIDLVITDVIYDVPRGLMKGYCIISFKTATI